jgi:hypothetical protein
MRRPASLLLALAVSLAPSLAWANPGLNPDAFKALLAVSTAQVVAVIALFFLRDPGELTALLVIMLGLAFFGLVASTIGLEALALQIPVGALILYAALKCSRNVAHSVGVAATLFALVCLPWAVYKAQELWRFPGASTQSLGGEDPPAPAAGRPDAAALP